MAMGYQSLVTMLHGNAGQVERRVDETGAQ